MNSTYRFTMVSIFLFAFAMVYGIANIQELQWRKAIGFLLGIGVVVESWIIPNYYNSYKIGYFEQKVIVSEAVRRYKKSCHKAFVLIFDESISIEKGEHLPYTTAAILTALEVGLPTVNGYSTFCPPGGYCYGPEVRDSMAVANYLKYHGLSDNEIREQILYLYVSKNSIINRVQQSTYCR